MRWSFHHWIAVIGWLILIGPALVSAQEESLAESDFEVIDFERHIAPLLRKHGCNAASCHGAAEGQAGFQLSLFGHDPNFDYQSLTAAGTGRVDREDPANSLFLRKPSLKIDHDGGQHFGDDSQEFALIGRWISQGAAHSPGSGRLATIDILPSRGILTEQRPELKVRVLATFANGDREDVTRFSEFQLHDDTVAAMVGGDVVRRAGQGETVLVAGYAGWSSSLRILVPQAGPQVDLDPESSKSMIDRHINARLLELNIEPAPRCSDTTFLRRLMLTTSGQLPTPNQIREFVLDENPEKRRRFIDAQLADPRHAALVFSRPERKLTCDCERSSEPTLRQSMLLLSDSDLQQRITSAIAHFQAGGDFPLEASIEELFLRTLSRWPDEEEKQTARQYVQAHADRQQALADVLWGLINTREFVTLN